MITRCRIELFGGLRLIQQAEVTTRFGTLKAGLLLAYLALSLPDAQPRERLVDLLWPDLDLDAGRNNLSTLLSLLRRQLEPRGTPAGAFLLTNRLTVGLNPETVQTDVGEFETLRQRAARAADLETRLGLLGQAADLARSELLPEAYEEWALRARERYREQWRQTLRLRATLLAEANRADQALEAVTQLLQQEAGDEETVRLQMRLLAEMGRAEAALESYHHLKRALKREFSGQPEAQTRALAEALSHSQEGNPQAGNPQISQITQIKSVDGENAIEGENATENEREGIGSQEGRAELSREERRGGDEELAAERELEGWLELPPALTRFFGREAECRDLVERLCDPHTRLITLLGPGGTGKTRLAVETTRRVATHFGGRVYFAPLADLGHPDLAPLALQNVLHLPAGKGDPLEAVVAALDGPSTLLVMDNLEHLLPVGETIAGKGDSLEPRGVQEVIRQLLARAPGLICLATSRQALGLEGEQEYPVPPLATPNVEGDPLEEWDACASVALYVDRARLAKPDFALTAYNAREVAAICRRLEGMPLAIEMAAAWIKTLPPARMLERLGRSLDVLVSRRRDLPPRHRSLRAACEWSYDLLTSEQQRLFACLCLFRGGWTLSAAEAVAGDAALWGMSELQNHSLIQLQMEANRESGQEPTGAEVCPLLAEPRFRMYEPLREFGLEMLEASGRRHEVAYLHAQWCVQLATEAYSRYRSPDEAAWIRALSRERDNLRAALEWCQQHDAGLGLKLAWLLIRYWEVCGGVQEGSQILDALLSHPVVDAEVETRARALPGAAALHLLQTNYVMAAAYYREAQGHFAALNDTKAQADALHGLGNIGYFEQRYEEAEERYKRSLELYETIGHERGIASANHSLGNLTMRLDRFDEARVYLERAVAIRRKLGDPLNVALTVGALAQLAFSEGRLDEALAASLEILPVFHERELQWAALICLGHIASIMQQQGQLQRAAILQAATHTLRIAFNHPVPPADQDRHDQRIQELRASLQESGFEALWREGLTFTLDQAVRFALEPA
jgi:predicted ATPase/DNA-binding SARP family transcriptional activator